MADAAKTASHKRRSLFLHGTGGPEKFQVVETDIPDVKDSEVMVRLKACGLNFAEVSMLQGFYSPMPKLPGVIGYEGAGVVEQVGKDVKCVKIGDRVICAQPTGLWQEIVVVPEVACFVMPDKMTFEEGAAIPINYLTAYFMLFEQAALKKGQSVLVHMAAGGVGTAAIQLCQSVGDIRIFGTASASKHEMLSKLGCAHPIDYRTKDYAEEIRKIAPEGVDIVLDPLGGKDAKKGFELLKPLGRIIHFGFANIITGSRRSLLSAVKNYFEIPKYDSIGLLSTNKSVSGFHLGYLLKESGKEVPLLTSAMSHLMQLYSEGKIRPIIDSSWHFEQVSQAMGRIHSRQNVGKIILLPAKAPEASAASGQPAEAK